MRGSCRRGPPALHRARGLPLRRRRTRERRRQSRQSAAGANRSGTRSSSLTDVDRFSRADPPRGRAVLRAAQGTRARHFASIPSCSGCSASSRPRSCTRAIWPRWKRRVPAWSPACRRACMASTDATSAISTAPAAGISGCAALYRPFVTHYVALSPDLDRLSARPRRRAAGADRADLQRRRYDALRARARRPAADRRLPVHGPDHWLVGTVGGWRR